MKRMISTKSQAAIWTLVGTMLFMASAQPSANGLDFPMVTRLEFPVAPVSNLSATQDIPAEAAVTPVISELAIVAQMAMRVEMARTPAGARKVAQIIMKEEYGWGSYQYSCLNHLWTKESHWNYKAHNYRSGAHGIAQALPATKMESISTDWRTNAVTQIEWGLTYIQDRYETPCGAWKKFQRSRYY